MSSISALRSNPNSAVGVVAFALFIDYMMVLMVVPLVPLYKDEFSLSTLQISVLFVSKSVASIVSSPGWPSARAREQKRAERRGKEGRLTRRDGKTKLWVGLPTRSETGPR